MQQCMFDEFKASAYRCKKGRSVAFKLRQNAFPVGALPRTPLGQLATLHRPTSQLGRGHPPYPTALGAFGASI